MQKELRVAAGTWLVRGGSRRFPTSCVAAVRSVEGAGGEAGGRRSEREARSSPPWGARLSIRRETGEKTSLGGRLSHISLAAPDLAPRKHPVGAGQTSSASLCFPAAPLMITLPGTARASERRAALARLAARSGSVPGKTGPGAACEPRLPRWGARLPAPLSLSGSRHAPAPWFPCGRRGEGGGRKGLSAGLAGLRWRRARRLTFT